ncbi:hypothetical protein [Pseudomonas sp. BF-R-01]|uniref:hypothetical protein n=1 Tax=Pseudomonas sp. BF-R-01 TaxID=2832365 RepID=UPI001CBDABB8|nr:hypothetical protein [Pseudomonas sp. BF-R-01]
MSRREEFLERAIELHHEFIEATSGMQAMMRENKAVGPAWDAAVARQIASLDAWMELPHKFEDLRADD